jgi:predicted RNA-binding Zn-ribbon protein involved in translation (DUF1610 family)
VMDRPLLHCNGCGRHIERGSEVCPECGVPVLPNLAKREIHSRAQAAAIVGVSHGYVQQAKQLAREAPDLAEKVHRQSDPGGVRLMCPHCGRWILSAFCLHCLVRLEPC